MFRLKYLDGTPVDAAYAAQVGSLVAGAAAATEIVSEDDLEQFAANQKEAEDEAGMGV